MAVSAAGRGPGRRARHLSSLRRILAIVAQNAASSVRARMSSVDGHRIVKAGLVGLPAGHDRPDDAGHLVCHGDARHARWLAGKQRDKVRIGRLGLMPRPADQRGRADHQELSQIPVTHLGNAAEPVFATTRVLRWREPEPGGKLPTRTELSRISDRCRQRCCTDRADAWNGR